MKTGIRKALISLSLSLGMLLFVAACTVVLPESEQTQPECPLPAGAAPPAAARVTAQQVEDGNASLTDFALAARDHHVSVLQEERAVEQTLYLRCLFRQEGSPWRSGSTYLVQLTPDGRVYVHAQQMSLSGRQLNPVIYAAILHALGIDPAALNDALAWLEFHERFWTGRLDALDALVGTLSGPTGEPQ